MSVMVYAQKGCATCARTKAFLVRNGVAFVEREVHEEPKAMDELVCMGIRQLPVTVIGDTIVRGFNPAEILKALRSNAKNVTREVSETMPLLGRVLEELERGVRQMPDERLDWSAPGRSRPMRMFIHHVPWRVQSAMRCVDTDVYERPPQTIMPGVPDTIVEVGRSYWSFQEVADYCKVVTQEYYTWWRQRGTESLAIRTDVDEDGKTPRERLDVVAGHTVHHLRQVYWLLEHFGVTPDNPMPETAFPREYILPLIREDGDLY